MGDLQWPKEQLVHRAGGPSVASFQSPAKLDLNESITKKSSPDQFQIPADKLSLQGPFISADSEKNLNSDLSIGKLCQHLYQSDLYLIQRKE